MLLPICLIPISVIYIDRVYISVKLIMNYFKKLHDAISFITLDVSRISCEKSVENYGKIDKRNFLEFKRFINLPFASAIQEFS